MLNLVLAALALLAAIPQARAATPAPYGHPADDYVITFIEEFDRGLSPQRWRDHIWYEPANPARNYQVENGTLKIWPQRDANGAFFNRTITTDGLFAQTYGYFEIDARLPRGKGVWPGFWLLNHDGDARPEIDIMEAYPGGGAASGWSDEELNATCYAVTVWRDADAQAAFAKIASRDLSGAFHKYAVKWEAHRISFYFDGRAVLSTNVRLNMPMSLYLDLWFGSASGRPDATTPTGKENAFEIRYVRVWRFR